MNKFKGVYPALCTPFTQTGNINEKSLRDIVNLNLNVGVKGFYVGGTTAEAFLLSLEERKQILEIVVDEVKERATVISHIGCISTGHAIELAKHAEKVGVDAIASVPPFYYKFSFNDIINYYKDIMDEVSVPMFVYNIPMLSGVTFSMDELNKLTEDKRVIGVKHTSMDLYQLERMKQMDERLVILHGHEQVFLGSLVMGADGAVGSTFNFLSEHILKIKRLFEESKLEEAKKLQVDVNDVLSTIIKVGVIPGVKAALECMGIECGCCRKPFKRLNVEEKELLKKVMLKYGLL